MIFLLHLTGLAVLLDLKYQKIPNELVITGFLCGLSYQIFCFQWTGFGNFLAGSFLVMVLTGTLYYFRMIGAGDIKLLAVIGGFLGPADGFRLTICTFLVGGMISAVLMIKRRNLFSRLFYLKTYIYQYIETKQWSPYRKIGCEDGYLYFSVPIFISLLLHIASKEQLLPIFV